MKLIVALLLITTLFSCSTFEERKRQHKEITDNISYENFEETENVEETVKEKEVEIVKEIEPKEEVVLPKEDTLTPANGTVELQESFGQEETEEFVAQKNELFYVIIGSFSKKEDAQNLLDELIDKGYPTADIVPTKTGAYRIAISTEFTKEQAKMTIDLLPEEYKSSSPWIFKQEE